MVITSALLTLPTLRSLAQASAPGTASGPLDTTAIVLIGALLVILIALPIGYVVLRRPQPITRSVLMVSTDEAARRLVRMAARRAGYNAITVYRYEDAVDRIREDTAIGMIIIDDSVPQYEAGLLMSMLQRLPMGVRPLILIHDSSELGQTAPSHRAAVVVARPLTEKALEAAIRQVNEHIDVTW
ncbi:MAG: hypothetical protein ABI947_00820 [Chloroflexota bacterium]